MKSIKITDKNLSELMKLNSDILWRNLQILALAFLILAFELWQIYGFGIFSFCIFSVGLLFLGIMCIGVVKYNIKGIVNRNTLLLLLFEAAVLFYFSQNYNQISSFPERRFCFFCMGSILLLILLQTRQLYFAFCNKWLHFHISGATFILWILAIIFSFALNIECFNTWIRWDAFFFYQFVDLKSAESIFTAGREGLMIGSHISTTYTLLILFLQSLPGISNPNAFYLGNMILMFLDINLFYHIFRYLIPNRKKNNYIIYAIVGGLSPYIFGMIGYISLEKMLLMGVLLFIYSFLSKNYFLGVFATFITCNSKEPGVLIIAGMTAFLLLYDLISYKKNLKQFISQFGVYYLSILMIGLCWLLHFNKFSWLEAIQGQTSNNPLIDGTELNTVQFSLIHCIDTIRGFLLANFNWIFVILIFFTVILILKYLFCGKIKISQLVSKSDICIIAIGGLVYLVFMCLFVTYSWSRYFTVLYGFAYILFIYCIENIFSISKRGEFIKRISVIGVGILLLIQSYITIDPVMLSGFPTINIGRGKLAAFPQHMSGWYDQTFTEAVNYNRQIMYFDKMLDDIYRKIEWNENVKVLFSNKYIAKKDKLGTIKLGSIYCFWGFGYSYMDPPMWGAWNAEGGYRYLSYKQENTIDPEYITEFTDLEVYKKSYEDVYFIEMPWKDDVLESMKKKYSNIELIDELKKNGWTLKIYKMNL